MIDPGVSSYEKRFETLGDADPMTQVFTNLFDNAVRPGSGDIKVTAAEDDLRFSDMFGIVVGDSSTGIVRKHIPRLTERLYRVEAATSRGTGGTGPRLATTKHLLNRHRGTLEVKSIPGEGSRIAVWLRNLETGNGTASRTS